MTPNTPLGAEIRPTQPGAALSGIPSHPNAIGRRYATPASLRDKSGDTLTAREIEVLATLVETGCNKVAAYRLEMSHRTLEIHLTAIRGKLGMTRHQAVCVYAYLAGVRDGLGVGL